MQQRKVPSFLNAVPPAVVTPKEILEVQRKITETDSALADVSAKVEDAAKKIEKLRAGIPTPPDRNEDREDLAAEIAIGNAKDGDLIAFDKETAAVMKAHDSALAKIRTEIAPVETVYAGLKRKAGVLSREIEGLRAEHRRLCLSYLMGQAEEAGKEYAEAVTRAVKAMDLVIVLASLHVRAGGSNMIGKEIGPVDFSPLGTESTRGTLPSLDPASRAAAYDTTEVAILESLKAEGLAVPFPETKPAPPRKARAPGMGEGIPVTIVRPEDDKYRQTTAITE